MIFKNKYKYPNLTLFFLILVLTYLLYRAGILEQIVLSLENLGYIGMIFVGMFFVSTFTVVPATSILFLMIGKFSVAEIAIVSGIGSVMGDYIIFHFIKDGLTDELKNIFFKVGGDSIFRAHWIVHTKYFGWLSPVIGAMIIASPLPDELGIGLLSIYKMSGKNFILLSWFLNTIGMFILLSTFRSISQ